MQKKNYYTYITEEKSTPLIYWLQSLQGELANFYFETVKGIGFFYLCRNNFITKEKSAPLIYWLQSLQGQFANFYFETVEGIGFFYLCRNNFPNFRS